jgi:thymidylate synthase
MEHTFEQLKISDEFFQWKMGGTSYSQGIISDENEERPSRNLPVLNNLQSIRRIRRLTPEEEEELKEKREAKEKLDKEIYGDGITSDRIFANIKKYQHEEYQYLNIIENILENGFWEEGRNGKTKSIFGNTMRFSLKDGKIPILTTKKTAWKTCLKELLWFIRGDTDNKILKEQGVHIWDANGSREFLDSRGLTDYEADELGPIYGYQWRNFNKSYFSNQHKNDIIKDYETNFGNFGDNYLENERLKLQEKGIDQLQQIINALKDPKQRTSRRLIMSAWNPCQLDQMALPPCHILCQFNVHDGNKLSCAMTQRSGDFPLGIPFNIASYSFLTHLIAKHCGLEAYEFVHFVGNCHIYEDHIKPMREQITREPFEFPTLSIKQIRENINDYEIDDFEIHNYKSHEVIKMKMVA